MEFHYTVESSQSLDDTIVMLERELAERKFGVLWHFDLAAKLREKGQAIAGEYRVLEVCNPAEAANILGLNELAGYFLPCKIVVYGIEGKTRIGLPKPTVLIGVLGDDALKSIADHVEATLVEAIDRCVAQ
ncbi:DUF302 domain-containing protein [Cohnella endophytica]|uniref:DUF302 domain-containing protein n=1 Tax=Cohnella endophytica TaxID=2419778 RepID=A0A494XTY6_9BACL|nr:DUF302 domain-containing protein [Cohnella endophytica]RKP54040.1 DUF302 domain-containing protein [Cohnella endophytica]